MAFTLIKDQICQINQNCKGMPSEKTSKCPVWSVAWRSREPVRVKFLEQDLDKERFRLTPRIYEGVDYFG